VSKKKQLVPDYTDLIIEHGLCPVSRTIDCSGEVDERMYRKILRGLRILTNQSSEPIVLVLNSAGGDLYEAFAIHNSILASPAPVDVHVSGICMSAALVILAAGRLRSASPLSSFMVHDGTMATSGEGETFLSQAARYKEELKMFKKIVISRANKSFKWTARDAYYWPDEALELGLIDEIK
jgi:ATP-dependent Clp protease protease subunit